MERQIIVLDQATADALREATAADPDSRLDPADAGDGLYVLSVECAENPAFAKFSDIFDAAPKPTFDPQTTGPDRYAAVKMEVTVEARPLEAMAT